MKEEGDKSSPSEKLGKSSGDVNVKAEGSNADQSGKEKGTASEVKKEKGDKDNTGEQKKAVDEGEEKDSSNADDSAGEEQFVNFDAMLRDLGQLEKVRLFVHINFFCLAYSLPFSL